MDKNFLWRFSIETSSSSGVDGNEYDVTGSGLIVG
jgi:hypothetical protein